MIVRNIIADVERRSTLRDSEGWLYDALTGGSRTVSGERVTTASAMTVSGYYAALRNISEDVGKLPLITYGRLEPRGKKRLVGTPLYRLLHDAPNPAMNSLTFRQTLTHHALGWGKGIAEIVWEESANATALWPLDPAKVTIECDEYGQNQYIVQGTKSPLPADRVFHLHGMGYDGRVGYSIATMARQSLGLAIATEKSGAAFFGVGSRPGGVLETDEPLDPDARERLRKGWEALFQGSDKAHKTAVLVDGMKWKPMAIPNEDAQWIESRQFSIEEMARWTRCPPHKLHHLLRATGWSTLEATNADYIIDTLMPWLVRWEQEIWRKLIPARDKDRVFAEHLVTGMLRGDTEARYRAYATGRQWGWLSANDILELENQNPIGEQGDIYLVPMNMMSADQVGKDRMLEVVPKAEPETGSEADTADSRAMRLLLTETIKTAVRESDGDAANIVDRVAKVHLPLLLDAYHRLLQIERDRGEAARKRGTMAEWAEQFYPEHEKHVRGALNAAVDACCGAIWGALQSSDMPDAVHRTIANHTADMARRHVTDSRKAIHRSEDGLAAIDPRQQAAAEIKALATLMGQLCGV